jgi:hypothetical protein
LFRELDRDPIGNGELTPLYSDDYPLSQCLIRAAAALTSEGLGRSDDREENDRRHKAIVLLACILWSRRAHQFHPSFVSFCGFDMRWGTGWDEWQKLRGRAWAHDVVLDPEHCEAWMALVAAAWDRVHDVSRSPAPSAAEAGPEAPPPSEPDNLMQRNGHFWRVRYLGKETGVKHVVGMDYIARLLSRPNDNPLPAAELEGTDSQALPPAETNEGKLPDDEAIKEYGERLDQIEREIVAAQKNHDHAAQERLQGEKVVLAAEVQRAKGLGGKLRQPETKTPAREAYNRVRGNLATARQAIADAGLPELAAHLEDCIKREDCGFAYRPGPQPPHWGSAA